MRHPVHTFVRAEEDKHTLTVYYRTDAGDLEKITFDRQGESGIKLQLNGVGARWGDEENIVDLFLFVDGAPGVEVFQTLDKEGNTVNPGVFVTHSMGLKLPGDDSHILSRQLSYFTYPAGQVAESLVNWKPHIAGIAYGDDHIIIECNTSTHFKLGLVEGQHRFTFTDYGVQDAPIVGFVYLTFSYLDENGKDWHVKFSAPDDAAARMYLELRDFLKAHKAEKRPKFEAVTPSYVWELAA